MASAAGKRGNPSVEDDPPSTNLLGIGYGTAKQFACMLTDANFKELPNNTSRRAYGSIENYFSKRYYQSDTNNYRIWADIIAALPKINQGLPGITYVVQSPNGMYIGKTLKTMGARYPGLLPNTGKMATIFGNFVSASDVLDVTLYSNVYPALVEGWCFMVAYAKQVKLLNKMDPG